MEKKENSQKRIDFEARFAQARRSPILTDEEVRKIVFRIQKGDADAEKELMQLCTFFVFSIVRIRLNKGEIMEQQIEKAIEAGTEGLILAAKKFGPSYHNFKFIPLAIWYIRHSIDEALNEQAYEDNNPQRS